MLLKLNHLKFAVKVLSLNFKYLDLYLAFLIVWYPAREDFLFVSGYNKDELADDDKPLSILGYLNGGGFDDHLEVHKDEVSRIDIREWDGEYTDFETRSINFYYKLRRGEICVENFMPPPWEWCKPG